MAHKTDDDGVEYFDVTTFLFHTRCLVILSRPFLTFFKFVHFLISWHYPKLTFSFWLSISFLTTLIPSGYTIILFLVVLILSCCFGMLHHYTQIFIKLFPDQELEASALQNYLQRSWGEEQNILNEYRDVLLKLDKLIATFNTYLEIVYGILKWEKPLFSFSVVLVIACTSVLLVIVDLRVLIFIFNNIIFLGSGILLQVDAKKKLKVQHVVTVSNGLIPGNVPVSEEIETVENVISRETKDFDIEDAEVIGCENLEISEASALKTTETSSEVNNPTVIQKFMDLRKRHYPSLSGECAGCQTSLMTILRRKYTCCNCGNQFCWKCCNQKVPKSFLGVTAPATKNDTVLLCVSCHQQLHEKK